MGRRQDRWKGRASLALKRKEAKLTKEITFGAKIQRTVDQYNKRAAENMALFLAEQKRQGKKAGEPIDIMGMLK
jgi:hypothetical protein